RRTLVMQTLLKNEKVEKKQFVYDLLNNHIPYAQIQEKLKSKYGKGMSNRDIKQIRLTMNKIPQDLNTYKQVFVKMFESLLSMKNLIIDPEIIEELNTYHDLYYDTRKELVIANLPQDLRKKKIIESISESLDEIKEGNYLSLEELKKQIE
ncbi:MAG: hypothetical protein ACTSWK_15455, partial [Promethearchaeota archaeon]